MLPIFFAFAVVFYLTSYTASDIRKFIYQESPIPLWRQVVFCLWNGYFAGTLIVLILMFAGLKIQLWQAALSVIGGAVIYYGVLRAVRPHNGRLPGLLQDQASAPPMGADDSDV